MTSKLYKSVNLLRYLMRLLAWLRNLYTPTSLIVLAAILFAQREMVTDVALDTDLWSVARVMFLLIGGNLFLGLASARYLRSLGQPLSAAFVIATHLNRLPARYLPGGVWQTVARGTDFSARGVRPNVVVALFFIEIGASLGLALAIGSTLVLISANVNPSHLLSALLTIGIGILFMTPVLARLVLQSKVRPSVGIYFSGVLAMSAEFAARGAAFAIYVGSFLPLLAPTKLAGIFWLSWAAGYVVPFAPQGLGVSELVSGWLLTGDTKLATIGLLFSFRLVSLFSDLACFTGYRVARLLCKHRRSEHETSNPSSYERFGQ